MHVIYFLIINSVYDLTKKIMFFCLLKFNKGYMIMNTYLMFKHCNKNYYYSKWEVSVWQWAKSTLNF